MRRRTPLTIGQRCSLGGTLQLIRYGLDEVTNNALNRRVTAPIIDAALNADRRLFTLTLRLRDTLADADFCRYPFDVPLVNRAPLPFRKQSLTAEEHRAVAAKLYRLRSLALTTGTTIANAFPKASGVSRASHAPDRALDRLRHLLDELFYRHHPQAFDSHVYHPGPTAVIDMSWPRLPHVASKGATTANNPCVVPVAHVGHLLAHQGVPSEN